MFHIYFASPHTAICNIMTRLKAGIGFVNYQEEKVSNNERLTNHKVDLTGREEADNIFQLLTCPYLTFLQYIASSGLLLL